jgi:hypothetical protein
MARKESCLTRVLLLVLLLLLLLAVLLLQLPVAVPHPGLRS